jgi:hypothetical protein
MPIEHMRWSNVFAGASFQWLLHNSHTKHEVNIELALYSRGKIKPQGPVSSNK